MKTLSLVLVIAFAGFWSVPSAHAGGRTFVGRVYDDATKTGIPALTVRLRPPKKSNEAERLVATDAAGKFALNELQGTRYLLEVLQGPEVIYRREVDVSKDTKIAIPLRKKN
jgi:hypothetical protein